MVRNGKSLSVPALLICLVLVFACSNQEAVVERPRPGPDEGQPEAPWRDDVLDAADVAPVYLAEWRKANNRATCAPIAFADVALESSAKPRAASFAGGWGVAYDLPELRSAFGIAGTGVSAADPSYSDWPFTRRWSDGSSAGYGPEGGTGPNQLAYLRIAGQGCLYNVWSRLGRSHLESLLSAIRFVSTRGP